MSTIVRSIRIGKKYRIKDTALINGNNHKTFPTGTVVEVIAATFDYSVYEITYLCEGEITPNGSITQDYVLLKYLEEL